MLKLFVRIQVNSIKVVFNSMQNRNKQENVGTLSGHDGKVTCCRATFDARRYKQDVRYLLRLILSSFREILYNFLLAFSL